MTDHDALTTAELLRKHREQWGGQCYHELTFGDLNRLIELLADELSAAQAQAAMVREECAKVLDIRAAHQDAIANRGDEAAAYEAAWARLDAAAIRALSISTDAGREICRDAERFSYYKQHSNEFSHISDGWHVWATSREQGIGPFPTLDAAIDAAKENKR